MGTNNRDTFVLWCRYRQIASAHPRNLQTIPLSLALQSVDIFFYLTHAWLFMEGTKDFKYVNYSCNYNKKTTTFLIILAFKSRYFGWLVGWF